MRISDKAIVLQSIRHGDKKQILKLFTQEHGLLTVVSHPGKSVTAKVRAGSIMPLNFLHVEMMVKQSRDLHQLSEASSYYSNPGISGSMPKLAIAQFLNEILLKSLKEQSINTKLFEFIEGCFVFLSESEHNFMNLHLFFLLELSTYLGFEPQNNFSPEEPYFDCREGRFTPLALAFPLGLNGPESQLLARFMASNVLKEKITNHERQQLLEILVAYYQLHIPGFKEVNSHEVLKEILR